MSNATLDAIRGHIDHVRARLESGQIDQASASSALASFRGDDARRADRSAHPANGTHLCPWNTCQATRHN